MKMEIPNTNHSPDANAGPEIIRERVFSNKMLACAIFASGVLVVLAVGSTAPAQETWAARLLALLAVTSTVMLWLRHRYTVHVWALLFSVMGAGVALLNDPGPHSFLYWIGRFGTALSLLWFGYELLKLGKRISGRRV
jgi:hypothetical protein